MTEWSSDTEKNHYFIPPTLPFSLKPEWSFKILYLEGSNDGEPYEFFSDKGWTGEGS